MDILRKQYEANIEIKPGSRQVVATISTDTLDRDNEIVLPSGLLKKQYNKNPVVLWSHDASQLPIGKCDWVKVKDNSIVAGYTVTDKTELARDIFELMKEGIINAHSIGFNPIQCGPPSSQEITAHPDWKTATCIHRKYELLEFSVCAVPANPEALAMSVGKSLSAATRKALGPLWEVKPDCWSWETKTEVAKPLPQPKYCRSLSEIRKQLWVGMNDNEILARLKGQI
jgi:HK97 family phage prohead protease